MTEIRPFRREDFDVLLELANQAYPSPKDNAEWLEKRKTFDESKRIRRHYVAIDASHVVGYGCLEQQSDDAKALRIYVVCSPTDMRGEIGDRLYSQLEQQAKALGTAILWAQECQDDENIRVFLTHRGFVEKGPYTSPDHVPIVVYRLDLPTKN